MAPDQGAVGAGTGEIVKGLFRSFDNVVLDKFGAFPCSLLGTFYTALPFHYRPDIATVLGEFGKDGFKIDLTVTKGTIPSGPVAPIVISTECSLFTCWVKFRILYVERFDKFVVKINVFNIVQLL